MTPFSGDQDIIYSVQKIIDVVKKNVSEDIEQDGQKILEVELYLRWLEGFDFVLTALEVSGLTLDSVVPSPEPAVERPECKIAWDTSTRSGAGEDLLCYPLSLAGRIHQRS